MKIWVSAFLTASLVASGSVTARAQTKISIAPAPLAKPDYASESVVFEQLTRVYRYAADGTGSKEITGVVAIHNQAGVKALSVLPFDFASSAEHVEIDYVRVRHADGSIVSTPATDAQELPTEVTRAAPFYSDIKEEQIPIRSLQPGDHLEYHIRIVRTKPESPGHIWGNESLFLPSSGVVALSETVEVHLPKEVYLQVWSPQHKPILADTPTERVYRWQSSQLEPVAGKEKNALLLLDKNPTLATDDDPRLPDISWTNFHSWAEVGAWYRSLEGSRTTPDDDIRARVTALTAGKSSAEDKTRALYSFVSSQVRYIGVAFGIGRYQPHDAGDVLRNQYGDCKDKTTLLISMLSAANVPADAVLIGAGITFNEAVPSPGSFNHAINLAHVDGKPVWLDSTAEVAPYQLLMSVIRGKKALVIPATGDAHIETTPNGPPFPNELHYQSVGTLDDKGTSHSHLTMDVRGDEEVQFRQGVRSVSPAQWDQLMQNVSYAMSFAGKVTNTQFSRTDDTAASFHLAYDYEREKNGDWDNLRILAQLPPVGLGDIDEKDPPVTPIELGDPHVEIDHAEMTLPKGWHADLPPSIHAKSSFATLDVTYKFENSTLITDRRIQILKKDIPASDWPAYHQWITDAKVTSENYIQLTNSSSSSTNAPSKEADNPDAADFVRQAAQAEQRNDLVDAKAKLDQAQKLNANQAFLWSNYGYLAMRSSNLPDAIADIKKELVLHPDEPFVSRMLASIYTMKMQSDAAIATLQTAISLDPGDEATVLDLASMLLQRGDNAGAEKALRSGLAAKPDNLDIQLQLGVALIHQHKNEEGKSLLTDVLAKTTDPGQLNNAAYTLSTESLDLPLAETSSRRSLALLDEATNNGETGPPARQRASLLVSAWDTLGWILYQQNKIAEAEPWIRAAWRNGNQAETGYHLAVILEQEKHPDQAVAQLDLAAVGDRGTDAAAVAKLIAAKRDDLLKSVAVLPSESAPSKNATSNDAKATLQNARIYTFPRIKFTPTGQGWATIELEITPQAITAFRIVQGDDSLQPLSDAVQHLRLDLQLPPETHAKLLRRGVLSCPASTTCQLVLVPTQDALSNP
jgi:tetratricopeptide (TPR) repeat protein